MMYDIKEDGLSEGQSKTSGKDQKELSSQDNSPANDHMAGSTPAQEHNPSAYVNTNEEIRRAIKDTLDCFQTCTETIIQCIAQGGKHAALDHVNLMMDCAKICNLNADFMIRNSKYHPQMCGLCADICDECADDCEKFDEDFMKKCASVCRRCAESCREMAN